MEYISLEQCANKVHRLTQKMFEYAQHGDWRAMANLETERQSSMESLFKHPAMPDAVNEIAGILKQILELDRESIELGNQARSALAQALDSNTQGDRALKAYTSNSLI